MRIGVLALQGGFAEHAAALARLGIAHRQVRVPKDLEGLCGLIIPGGESTSLGILATAGGLVEPLRSFAATRPVWGVCAGLVFLARDPGCHQTTLGVMDIQVARNAYGRQRESFQAEVQVADLGAFPGVFIRAPRLVAWGKTVLPLAWRGDEVVGVRQGMIWATAFHPELTADTRLHVLWAELCR